MAYQTTTAIELDIYLEKIVEPVICPHCGARQINGIIYHEPDCPEVN